MYVYCVHIYIHTLCNAYFQGSKYQGKNIWKVPFYSADLDLIISAKKNVIYYHSSLIPPIEHLYEHRDGSLDISLLCWTSNNILNS